MGVRASVSDGAGASRSEGEGARLPQVIGEYTRIISRGDLMRVGELLREHGYRPDLTLQADLNRQEARQQTKREKRRLGRQAERRARSEARGGVSTASCGARSGEVNGEP